MTILQNITFDEFNSVTEVLADPQLSASYADTVNLLETGGINNSKCIYLNGAYGDLKSSCFTSGTWSNIHMKVKLKQVDWHSVNNLNIRFMRNNVNVVVPSITNTVPQDGTFFIRAPDTSGAVRAHLYNTVWIDISAYITHTEAKIYADDVLIYTQAISLPGDATSFQIYIDTPGGYIYIDDMMAFQDEGLIIPVLSTNFILPLLESSVDWTGTTGNIIEDINSKTEYVYSDRYPSSIYVYPDTSNVLSDLPNFAYTLAGLSISGTGIIKCTTIFNNISLVDNYTTSTTSQTFTKQFTKADFSLIGDWTVDDLNNVRIIIEHGGTI